MKGGGAYSYLRMDSGEIGRVVALILLTILTNDIDKVEHFYVDLALLRPDEEHVKKGYWPFYRYKWDAPDREEEDLPDAQPAIRMKTFRIEDLTDLASFEADMSTQASVTSASFDDRFWYRPREFYERTTTTASQQFCPDLVSAGESIDSAKAFILAHRACGCTARAGICYEEEDPDVIYETVRPKSFPEVV